MNRTSDIQVFDRALLRRRRDRVSGRAAEHGFLFEEVSQNILERLALVKKEFPVVLDLGSAHGHLSDKLRQRPGTGTVISADLSGNVGQAGIVTPVVLDVEMPNGICTRLNSSH